MPAPGTCPASCARRCEPGQGFELRPSDLVSWPNHEISRMVEAAGMRWHVQQAGSGPFCCYTGPVHLRILGTVVAWVRIFPGIARRIASPISVSRMLESTGSRLSAEGIELYVRLMRDADHVAGTLAMLSQWDLEPFARDLPNLPTPLTLLVGDNDKTVPPRRPARYVRGCARRPSIGYPDWGTWLMRRRPGLIAQTILRASGLRE
jgi:pimeloyl-ACP methyl ester carboxylesterase